MIIILKGSKELILRDFTCKYSKRITEFHCIWKIQFIFNSTMLNSWTGCGISDACAPWIRGFPVSGVLGPFVPVGFISAPTSTPVTTPLRAPVMLPLRAPVMPSGMYVWASTPVSLPVPVFSLFPPAWWLVLVLGLLLSWLPLSVLRSTTAGRPDLRGTGVGLPHLPGLRLLTLLCLLWVLATVLFRARVILFLYRLASGQWRGGWLLCLYFLASLLFVFLFFLFFLFVWRKRGAQSVRKRRWKRWRIYKRKACLAAAWNTHGLSF